MRVGRLRRMAGHFVVFCSVVVHAIVGVLGWWQSLPAGLFWFSAAIKSGLAGAAVGDWFLLVFGVSFTELSGARSTQFCWSRGQTRLRKPFLRGSEEPALFCLRFMTVMAPRRAINPSYGGRHQASGPS